MNDWLSNLVNWVLGTSLHQTMVTVEWAVPFVQTIHILAIAVVFGSSLVLTLRTFGLAGMDWSPADWGKRLNSWIGWALMVLLVTGALMIGGEPKRSLLHFLFQTKMLLLLIAIGVAMLLARGMRQLEMPESIAPSPLRLQGGVLVALWLAIIMCGRWIAYS